MFIPGILIAILTFPGIIVHELAHQLFCRWCRVAVFKVVYFQTETPAGYVLHEIPKYKYQSILISMGPFFINTILGFLIALPAAIQLHTFDDASIIDYLFIYLGVSIAMHAFPSTGDAEVMWSAVSDEDTNILLKIITAPLVGLIYLGAFGSMIWLDVIYGLAICIWLPNGIVNWIS